MSETTYLVNTNEVRVHEECREDEDTFGISCKHIVSVVDDRVIIMKFMNAVEIVTLLRKEKITIPDHFSYVVDTYEL